MQFLKGRGVFALFIACNALYGWQATATVSGRVLTEAGGGVPNALVVLMPPGPSAESGPLKTFQSLTDADGGYRIEGVGVGDYVACAQSSDRELLSSCRWAGQERRFRLTGSGASGFDLNVPRGVVLRFRVDDPEGVLPRTNKPNVAGVFLAGVWTKEGRFEIARIFSDDAQGVDYLLTVPTGLDLLPSVDCRNCRILGTDGALLRTNALTRTVFDGSQREVQFRFRVTDVEVRRPDTGKVQ